VSVSLFVFSLSRGGGLARADFAIGFVCGVVVVVVDWARLDWIGLDWIGLDWIDWIGLDWERRGGEEGFFFRR